MHPATVRNVSSAGACISIRLTLLPAHLGYRSTAFIEASPAALCGKRKSCAAFRLSPIGTIKPGNLDPPLCTFARLPRVESVDVGLAHRQRQGAQILAAERDDVEGV